MRGTAPKEEQCWSLCRTPAYENALRAVARSRFPGAYRYLLQAERLLLATEGVPPGLVNAQKAEAEEQILPHDLIEEAVSLDHEYDDELFKHHAPRVGCFFYKKILICFTRCELNEVITMTTFKLPDELFSDEADKLPSQVHETAVGGTRPSTGYVMELLYGSLCSSQGITLQNIQARVMQQPQSNERVLSGLTPDFDIQGTIWACEQKGLPHVPKCNLLPYELRSIKNKSDIKALKLFKSYGIYTITIIK